MLAELYWLLREEDMWASVWQRHARYRETNLAIAFEQQGFYDQAQTAYEDGMVRLKTEQPIGPLPLIVDSELRLWEDHWIR